MRDKSKILLLLFLFIFVSISSAYLYLPDYFQSLDSRVRDFYFKVRGSEKVSDDIVIIDIDEKSLKVLGQWPWERDKVARILQNLSDNDAGIIGLDIIFSEADKTSPKNIAKKFKLKMTNLPDYDEILARVISQTPTILGYVFDFHSINNQEAPQIPAIFIQKHKSGEFLPKATGVTSNIKIIQDSSYSSGFMNNIPDNSGIIRSVPMFINYDMEIYPALAFEMYRIAVNSHKVILNYSNIGIDDVVLNGQHIRSDRFGKLYLNFRGPFRSYKYISAVDIFNNTVDKSLIEGKFVLIGTSAYGLMDLRSTPMDSVIAGVEIHANMLDNLLHNDMLYKPTWIESLDLLIIFIIVFIVLFIFSRLSLVYLLLAYSTLFVMIVWFNYYMLFNKFIILNTLFPIFSMIFSLIAILGIDYMFEQRQKQIIKNSFAKKVSKQVMEDLLIHPEATDLSAREENVTMYFSDIRSFTTISENLHSASRVMDFLNFYMNAMVAPIERSNGTIDKFIGDAVMAYWNAPLKVKNHADKAVQTALEQISMRDEINIVIHKEFGFDVDFGIGINTANVLVGEIGSDGRSDYTVVGDGVNLASRLEGLCKPYKVRLVISEFTKELLQEEYVTQLLDIVRVKGKHEPVKIYEVLSLGKSNNEKEKELVKYNKAHDLYLNARFEDAQVVFNELSHSYGKYLYEMYSSRCEHLKGENLDEFDGIFEFITK